MFERLKEDVTSVFERDPASRHVFEILTTYPGTHALLVHRMAHWLWRHQLKWLARAMAYGGRWFTGIEIHPGATIGRRFFIDHGTGVVIGETAEIGDDVTLYHGVTLGGTTWNKGKRHPTLGNDVVIGAGAKILGPVVVGTGARIGSNAVVLKDVPASATMVGIPARQIVRSNDAWQKQRQATAERIGFDAYGVTDDLPDPVTQAIDRMLDHIHVTDQRLEEIGCILRRLGEHVDTVKPLELEWLNDCKQQTSTAVHAGHVDMSKNDPGEGASAFSEADRN